MNIFGSPDNFGEQKVKRTLEGFGDNQLWAWFSITYIPGVKDLDVLVLHEVTGCFGIEIKAVPLDQIESISRQSIKIKSRKEGHSPQLQAYNATTDLRNYAQKRRHGFPFTVSTACWPEITRSEWLRAFQHDPSLAEIARSQIFQDDLLTPEAFKSRLSEIYSKPPIRQGAFKPYTFDKSHLITFLDILDAESTQPDLPSVSTFLKNETKQRNQLQRTYPLSETNHVRFIGIPGSGKTFSLLALALAHGTEGNPVLLLCYNKALAAQLRANIYSIAQERNDPELTDFIEVFDIYEHVSLQTAAFGIDVGKKDYLDWIDLVLQELSSVPPGQIKFPDILLVDETQDFPDPLMKWIQFWSQNSFWVGLAEGTGQEVYQQYERSQLVLDWLNTFKRESLTKNYRNPGISFVTAYIFSAILAGKSDVEAISKELKKKISKRELDLSRPDEIGLEIVSYDDDLEAELASLLKATILHEIESGKTAHDILVISRTAKLNNKCRDSIAGLLEQSQIHGMIDLTVDAQKRSIPMQDDIRLTTFESSRGLEAKTVIVVGVEGVRNGIDADANLALIALSRGIEKTIVMFQKRAGARQKDTLEAAVDGARYALGHIK
ncbi:hypothetical protein N8Z80_02505 [Litorivicinus sp.]|nr:hypothetical protein [Litorivicinus sp.]